MVHKMKTLEEVLYDYTRGEKTLEEANKALKELGWQAQYGIEDMCASSYKWQSMNPDGYKG